EWMASEMRPRLPLARPAPSLSAISASAATTETRGVRPCGVIATESPRPRPNAESPPERALSSSIRRRLRVGDVAVELLVQERPGALPLVLPVAEHELLMAPRRVVEVELAVRAVHEARERRARPEETSPGTHP